MTFEEILKIEDANSDRIYLHLEGMFLRAYNQSAFLCWDRIAKFKLTRRFVKTVNTHFIYLGFPENTKGKWLHDRKVVKLTDKLFMVEVEGGPIDEAAYLQFEEAARVETETKDRYTVHTSVIEGQPVYQLAVTLMQNCLMWGRNVPKTDLEPYGNEMKWHSYEAARKLRSFYDSEDRDAAADEIQSHLCALQFALTVLKDAKDISENAFALGSEQSSALYGQVELLRKPAKGKEKT